ncbi:MAG: sugar phosphate nucleotidyltransferase [FCB group bacterium]|nr:sugar phosphate nucleotidyltransferase [FCB group bacterium]
MQITKAVITAAGRGIGLYPAADTVQRGMLPLVDSDGLAKPVMQIIAEEALDSGIEEVCVVCAPGDGDRYIEQFRSLRENLLVAFKSVDWAREQAARIDNLLKRLRFAVQAEPRGYGDAVSCAREFVGNEPFLLLLSDHLYLSQLAGRRCARQLMEAADTMSCSVAAVHATREHLVGRYGTLSGKRLADAPGLYQIENIVEKPSLSRAELELHTPGLRVGHYLCFFGMHVLTPRIFELLDEERAKSNGDLQLTPALNTLTQRDKYLALEIQGSRYDIGARFGLFEAQVALGLAGPYRSELLSKMVDLLAEAQLRPACREETAS